MHSFFKLQLRLVHYNYAPAWENPSKAAMADFCQTAKKNQFMDEIVLIPLAYFHTST